jgi:hypothetical protein
VLESGSREKTESVGEGFVSSDPFELKWTQGGERMKDALSSAPKRGMCLRQSLRDSEGPAAVGAGKGRVLDFARAKAERSRGIMLGPVGASFVGASSDVDGFQERKFTGVGEDEASSGFHSSSCGCLIMIARRKGKVPSR